MALVMGSTLENRYRIEQLLGQGGMGAVYCARDTRLQKSVAIKENTVVAPGISPEAIVASRRQFEREALVLARLRHPNLPSVTDHFVTPDGNQYLVMDYIEGENLAQIMASQGPLPEAQAVAWIAQVCNALEYLHTRQPPIVHRDIKPQNIKVTPEGQIFLVDFGIAKVGGVDSKTTMGALGMTPGFSPPEQYKLTGTDARSDIYALGATLYALLTGQTPPESLSLLDGEARLVPPSQVNVTVTPGVQQAVLKAMQARRTDRPQTVAEFRQMLTLNLAKVSEPSQGLPPTQLMGATDKRIPASPPSPQPHVDRVAEQPRPISRPSTPPSASPSAYPARGPRIGVAPSAYPLRNPLLFLLAGAAGIVLAVLVALVIVAIWWSSQGKATPAPPVWQPTAASAVGTVIPGAATPSQTLTRAPSSSVTDWAAPVVRPIEVSISQQTNELARDLGYSSAIAIAAQNPRQGTALMVSPRPSGLLVMGTARGPIKATGPAREFQVAMGGQSYLVTCSPGGRFNTDLQLREGDLVRVLGLNEAENNLQAIAVDVRPAQPDAGWANWYADPGAERQLWVYTTASRDTVSDVAQYGIQEGDWILVYAQWETDRAQIARNIHWGRLDDDHYTLIR